MVDNTNKRRKEEVPVHTSTINAPFGTVLIAFSHNYIVNYIGNYTMTDSNKNQPVCVINRK